MPSNNAPMSDPGYPPSRPTAVACLTTPERFKLMAVAIGRTGVASAERRFRDEWPRYAASASGRRVLPGRAGLVCFLGFAVACLGAGVVGLVRGGMPGRAAWQADTEGDLS
jgi:hypothetical protein